MCEKRITEVTPEMIEAGADAIFDVAMRVTPGETMDLIEMKEAASLAYRAMIKLALSEGREVGA